MEDYCRKQRAGQDTLCLTACKVFEVHRTMLPLQVDSKHIADEVCQYLKDLYEGDREPGVNRPVVAGVYMSDRDLAETLAHDVGREIGMFTMEEYREQLADDLIAIRPYALAYPDWTTTARVENILTLLRAKPSTDENVPMQTDVAEVHQNVVAKHANHDVMRFSAQPANSLSSSRLPHRYYQQRFRSLTQTRSYHRK